MKTHEKHPVIAVLAVLVSLWGCSYFTNEERADLQTEEQQEQAKWSQDSLQMSFAQTLDEIDYTLDLIREKEGALILGPESAVEPGISKPEHIKRNISIINSLMEQNKEKLRKLSAQLKRAKANNELLTKLTSGAKERILKQEEEIAQLKNQLTDRSFELAQLNLKMNDVQLANAMLQDKANKLEKDAQSAYYAVGSYTELKKENVITKKGGVFGIGSKKTLKEDFKKDYFTEVDTRETKYIPLFAKKAKLMTFHPQNSFVLTKENGKISYLEIKDPDEFWKASRILVVEVQI